MANIKDLIQSIEAPDSSFDEKLAAITQMEETLVAMQQQEEEAINDNVDLIVEAINVMQKKVDAQLVEIKGIIPEKGDKGDKGDKGIDGKNGRDGKDGVSGKDGKDGVTGVDGVSVTDARIDFDGSLIITLSSGRELNVGEVVAPDLAEKIKVITTMSTNGAVVIKDEGSSISSGVKSINFVGATVTATNSGDDVTVSVAGSVYNPSSVAITGGSINNTTIGATTPSTGAFTTLSASSTVSGTGFSTYLASPPAIGGTSPAAGTFTTLIGGGGSANYGQLTGGATTKAMEFKSLGSDTNVAMALRSQGTGAIDLAAGSSGVNISNGGTVTAITRTAGGSGYTTVPTWTATAPTTAGGVQATGTVTLSAVSAVVSAGGSGYLVGDVLTIAGGTFSSAVTVTVATLSGSAVATVTITSFGNYTVTPSNPASVTGGTGTGATFTLSFGITTSFTITNAGSGYVEQPTVSFSGGGGSGASAYATVGSGSIIRALGATGTQSLDFYTPSSATNSIPVFRLRDNVGTGYFMAQNLNGSTLLVSQGGTNDNAILSANGTGSVRFSTNGTSLIEQLRVSHTASAVNYVQITGAATGTGASISSQGSDTSVALVLQAKGASGTIGFGNSSALNNQAFRVSTGAAINTGNLILVTGAIAGSAPSISAISGTSGTDTNIDLALTPKGTGLVAFGTYTAGAPAATGYISVKSAAGVTYKILVST